MQRVAAGQFWRTRTAEMFPSKAKLLRLPEWLVCLSASRLPLQFGKKKQKNKPKRKEEIHSFECLWGSAEWMHTMGVYTAEVFPAFRDCTSQYFVDWRINLRCFFFIKPFFFLHTGHTHTQPHTHTPVSLAPCQELWHADSTILLSIWPCFHISLFLNGYTRHLYSHWESQTSVIVFRTRLGHELLPWILSSVD